jgi:hypothetical protein
MADSAPMWFWLEELPEFLAGMVGFLNVVNDFLRRFYGNGLENCA